MKTLILECRFTIEVPWDEEACGSPYFQIEENGCPGTGSVGGVLNDLIEAADENDICWACMVAGKNKILRIEDREPRNYLAEIQVSDEVLTTEVCQCGRDLTVRTKRNSGITRRETECANCGATTSGMDMKL